MHLRIEHHILLLLLAILRNRLILHLLLILMGLLSITNVDLFGLGLVVVVLLHEKISSLWIRDYLRGVVI